MTGPRTAREWALAYAELGWRAFPVVPGGKRPLHRGWQRDATIDPAQIERYWPSEPEPNIGIVCGEAFDAFDIEAAQRAALRASMEALGRGLPLTPLAWTGRGGIHILVQPTGAGGGRDLYLEGVHVRELKSVGGFAFNRDRRGGCRGAAASALSVVTLITLSVTPPTSVSWPRSRRLQG